MSEKNNRHESKDTSSTGFRDKTGLERLIFFSDAVFAIAITLLVIDIRLPDTDNILDNAQLTAQLLGMWQQYLGYIISFLVIGTFWTAHHRKFRYIKRYDYRLLFLNLLMLMVIEIFYTVHVSFKEHVLSPEPFFIVGLIAAIRRILVISVESAYMPEKFNNHMIEISILGGLIFIFVISLILLRKYLINHN